jgi:hypothetical protein
LALERETGSGNFLGKFFYALYCMSETDISQRIKMWVFRLKNFLLIVTLAAVNTHD